MQVCISFLFALCLQISCAAEVFPWPLVRIASRPSCTLLTNCCAAGMSASKGHTPREGKLLSVLLHFESIQAIGYVILMSACTADIVAVWLSAWSCNAVLRAVLSQLFSSGRCRTSVLRSCVHGTSSVCHTDKNYLQGILMSGRK